MRLRRVHGPEKIQYYGTPKPKRLPQADNKRGVSRNKRAAGATNPKTPPLAPNLAGGPLNIRGRPLAGLAVAVRQRYKPTYRKPHCSCPLN